MDSEKISTKESAFVSIEKAVSIWHRMVLPLVLIQNGQFKSIGTAFVVNPYAAYLVTAKHNIEAVYPIENDFNVDEKRDGILHVFYVCDDKLQRKTVGNVVQVRQIYMNNDCDVAVLRTAVPVPKGKGAEHSYFKALPLNFNFPNIGEKCLALGYNKMDWTKLDERNIELLWDLKASEGKIEEVHFPKRDGVMINFPAMRTSARFDSGMSGGPIFSEKDGVVGVVSSSIGADADFESFTSYGAMSSCLLPISINNDVNDISVGKKFLYELVLERKIASDLNKLNFQIIEQGDNVKIELENGYGFLLENVN